MRTSIIGAGVAVALLLTGCADAGTGGRPTVGTTQEGPAQTPDRTGPERGFATDPGTPVIEFSSTDATVDGVQGVARTVVYGDGTVLRPDPDGGWTVAHLARGAGPARRAGHRGRPVRPA